MITLPTNFVTGILTTIGGVLEDIMPLIVLVFGIYLGFFVIEAIIGLVARVKEEKNYYEKNR